MNLVIYPSIRQKLKDKHGVSENDVWEAFLNRHGKILRELRPKNQGEYPRYWFVSETNNGHRLKVVFATDPGEPGPVIISAYEPDSTTEEIYAKYR